MMIEMETARHESRVFMCQNRWESYFGFRALIISLCRRPRHFFIALFIAYQEWSRLKIGSTTFSESPSYLRRQSREVDMEPFK